MILCTNEVEWSKVSRQGFDVRSGIHHLFIHYPTLLSQALFHPDSIVAVSEGLLGLPKERYRIGLAVGRMVIRNNFGCFIFMSLWLTK